MDIQKVRFAERLQLSVDIPSELSTAQVPNLILQPIVENAVKHGIAPLPNGGDLVIRAAITGDSLRVEEFIQQAEQYEMGGGAWDDYSGRGDIVRGPFPVAIPALRRHFLGVPGRLPSRGNPDVARGGPRGEADVP